MNNYLKYVKHNWHWAATALVMGLAFAYWGLPYLWSTSWGELLLSLSFSPFLLFLIIVSILAMCIADKGFLSFYIRYNNNYKLTEIPFTYVDAILLFLLPVESALFYYGISGKSVLPMGIQIYLASAFTSLLLWYGLIRRRSKSAFYKEICLSEHKISTDIDYFSDEPIIDENQDLLGRKQFVEDLYNQITKYPFPDSFVFGLYGSWGEGKTSSINLLKNRLYKNEDIIIFEYDPWYYASPDSLIKGFYEGLYASLNRKYFLPDLKRSFEKYQKILSPGLKLSGIKGFDTELSIGPTRESLEELKERIQDYISLIGKKVIIIIDDIDRLDKNGIELIFKIVKLSGKFKNTLFVMSFDHNIVSSLLTDASHDPLFLEKIVQSPVHLPAIEQTSMDQFLLYSYPDQAHYSAIDRLFKKLSFDIDRIKVFHEGFDYLYESHIKKLFPTLRSAKRYLNGLYSRLPSVKNEVNLQDFLILELIRTSYPVVYEDIWKQWWHYIPSWNNDTYIASPFHYSNEKQKYEKIKEHITNVIGRQEKKEVLQELLETIFFVVVKNAFGTSQTDHSRVSHTYREEKRITHPDVFPKYFMLKVPTSELPDETIESLLLKWSNTEPSEFESRVIDEFTKFKHDKRLMELLNKLIVFRQRFSQDTAKLFIKALYKNIGLFSKEGRENLWHWQSEFYKAEFLMVYLINEKIENSEIEPLLKEAISKTPSIEFAVHIVSSCRPDRGGSLFKIYENTNVDDLKKVLSDRLTQHFIDGGRNIFEEEKEAFSSILYQWVTANSEDREKVNIYLFSLIDKYPKYLGNIISRYLGKPADMIGQGEMYNKLIMLYDESKLYEAVKKHYSNAYSDQREKSAIDLFIKTHDERLKSAMGTTQQAANQQKFSNYMNNYHHEFDKGNFNEALQYLNEALNIQDWKDEQGWISQAVFYKWKCLLELAWNNGKPLKKFFYDASKIAANEARIKELVDEAYRDGHPDQAPIQIYYCLFYYLQWYFADESQKAEIKQFFMLHHEIATGGHTSGRSDEITSRCNDFLNRISSKP